MPIGLNSRPGVQSFMNRPMGGGGWSAPVSFRPQPSPFGQPTLAPPYRRGYRPQPKPPAPLPPSILRPERGPMPEIRPKDISMYLQAPQLTQRANLNNIYAYYPQPQLTQQQMAGSAYGMPWLADLSRRVSPLNGLYG